MHYQHTENTNKIISKLLTFKRQVPPSHPVSRLLASEGAERSDSDIMPRPAAVWKSLARSKDLDGDGWIRVASRRSEGGGEVEEGGARCAALAGGVRRRYCGVGPRTGAAWIGGWPGQRQATARARMAATERTATAAGNGRLGPRRAPPLIFFVGRTENLIGSSERASERAAGVWRWWWWGWGWLAGDAPTPDLLATCHCRSTPVALVPCAPALLASLPPRRRLPSSARVGQAPSRVILSLSHHFI